MNQNDIQTIGVELTRRCGLSLEVFSGISSDGSLYLEIRPSDLDRPIGFTVRVDLGWRNLRIGFHPGSFAGDLISSMGRCSIEDRAACSAILCHIEERGANVSLSLNGKVTSHQDVCGWPDTWSRFDLEILKSPLPIDSGNAPIALGLVMEWLIPFMSALLTLLPVEEEASDPLVAVEANLPEGAQKRVVVNRYERSSVNRSACIAIHGYRCKACGFDFGDFYGDLGEGYIHVHHLVPVSQLGTDYLIDPACDLVPLCANCHAIVHRLDPPLEVQELKAIVMSRRKRKLEQV